MKISLFWNLVPFNLQDTRISEEPCGVIFIVQQ
jgi:hypothetical protein